MPQKNELKTNICNDFHINNKQKRHLNETQLQVESSGGENAVQHTHPLA